jgi:cytochrome P450
MMRGPRRTLTLVLYRMDFGWVFSLMPYGERWRRSRKPFHAHFHQGVVHQYGAVQLESARRLARDILTIEKDKEALLNAAKASFGRSIIKMVYGIDAADSNSEYISLPQKVLGDIDDAVTPGRFLVDFFPIREW